MRAPWIVPSQAACLIIDMQNGFVHPESEMGRSVGVTSQQAIIPTIEKLVNLCRLHKIPLLWSKQEHFKDDVTRLRRRSQTHATKQGFLPCLRGTWETQLEKSIQNFVSPDDHIIEKHRASVFYNTNLETKLRMLGANSLIIAGCNTEFCVESTVRDAYARDLDIVVLRDGVAGIREEFHAASLKTMEAYFAEVVTLAQFVEVLDLK